MTGIRFDPNKVFLNSETLQTYLVHCDTLEKERNFLKWLVNYFKEKYGKTLRWKDEEIVKPEDNVHPLSTSGDIGFFITENERLAVMRVNNVSKTIVTYEEVLIKETIHSIDKNKVFPKGGLADSICVHCDTEEKAKLYINWLVECFKASGEDLKWSCGSKVANKKGHISEYSWCYYAAKTCYSVSITGRLIYSPIGNDIYAKYLPYNAILLSEKVEFDLDKIEDELVHCDTEEKAKTFLSWAQSIGAKWRRGESCDVTYYSTYGINTCYRISEISYDKLVLEFSDKPSTRKVIKYEDAILKPRDKGKTHDKEERTSGSNVCDSHPDKSGDSDSGKTEGKDPKGDEKAVPNSELKVGDRVIFVKNDVTEYIVSERNPLISTEYECEGVVEKIGEAYDDQLYFVHVLWDNGSRNKYEDYTLAKVKALEGAKESTMVKFDPKKVFIEGKDDSSNRIHCNTLEKAIAFGTWMLWYQKEVLKKSGLELDRINSDWSIQNVTDSYKEYKQFTCFRMYDGRIRYGEEKLYTTIPYEDALLEKPESVTPVVEFDKKKVSDDNWIHCKTQPQAKAFFIWLKSLGAKWCDGEECIPTDTRHFVHGSNTAYSILNEKLFLQSDRIARHCDTTKSVYSYDECVVKEEIEEKITEFNRFLLLDYYIRCRTEEQAQTLFTWLESIGVSPKWDKSAKCSPKDTQFSSYKEDTLYFVDLTNDEVSVDDAYEFGEYEYKDYEDFLINVDEQVQPEKIKGLEVEFDADKLLNTGAWICCKTRDQAVDFLDWACSKKFKWSDGDSLNDPEHYHKLMDDTHYNIHHRKVYFASFEEVRRWDFKVTIYSYEDCIVEKEKAMPEFDLSAFKKGKFGIKCATEKEVEKFFEYLESRDIYWGYKDKCNPSHTFYEKNPGGFYNYQSGGLYYLKSHGLEYKDFSSFTFTTEPIPISFDLSKLAGDLGIHCRTEEQANALFSWLKSINAVWRGGETCRAAGTNYGEHEGSTVYFIESRKDRVEVCYDSTEDCVKYGLKFGPYEYFLKKNENVKTTKSNKKQTKKPTTNESKRKEQPMKKLSVASVIANAKNAAETTKATIIQAQTGTALLAAVKAAMNKGPLPKTMADLINEPIWGDFVTGIILHTVVPTVTDSVQAEKAVEAANVVASVGLSGHFSWLQDTIKAVIENTVPELGKGTKKA